jgi:hypothetical protein
MIISVFVVSVTAENLKNSAMEFRGENRKHKQKQNQRESMATDQGQQCPRGFVVPQDPHHPDVQWATDTCAVSCARYGI